MSVVAVVHVVMLCCWFRVLAVDVGALFVDEVFGNVVTVVLSLHPSLLV